MSDTMAALFILPVLLGLVVALECARTGCTWLHRRVRGARRTPALYSQALSREPQDF